MKDDIVESVFEQWFDEDPDAQGSASYGHVRSLLKALGLGVSQVNSLAKVIFGKEDDAMKQDFLDKCLDKKLKRRFGIWKS